MKLTLLLTLLVSFNAFSFDTCKSINEYQLKMDAHASNFKNAETTRTAEGGAYKYKKVKCKESCKIDESELTALRYRPTHPDANKDGYVNFPVINKEEEKAYISASAKSLIMVAKACPSIVRTFEIETGPAVLMTYNSGDIVSDTINFEEDGKIISWVRQAKNGESMIVNL